MRAPVRDTRVACLDVDYRATIAVAAGVWLRGWEAAEAEVEVVTTLDEVAPYQPGELYRRELPCLLAVLERGPVPEVVVVDGMSGSVRSGPVWEPTCIGSWESGRKHHRTIREIAIEAMEREMARREWHDQLPQRRVTDLGCSIASLLKQERQQRERDLG